ncbi:hypothetical protein J7E93_27205 [Streptomyces sp. ISL-36]|uniref:hypothetical protein n=1 Tax=Streptomyces sp. ISL-36 TaxID=2819182 RepID=UPI001BE8984A|nr:hypothetical protein [Streptomyces sp. ISL-36]MBT2443719.1 hypothetical protein [Streptomyces sp. ISL-36]
MKKFLEILGVVVLIGGVSGVLRELTGWFPFMGFTRFLTENVWFLDGKELFANIVIAVLGFVVLIVADRVKQA